MRRLSTTKKIGLAALLVIALGCGGATSLKDLYERYIVGSGPAIVRALNNTLRLDIDSGTFEREIALFVARILGIPDIPALLLIDAFDFRTQGVVPDQPISSTFTYNGEMPDGVNETDLRFYRVQEFQATVIEGAVFDYETNTVTAPVDAEATYAVAYARPEDQVQVNGRTVVYGAKAQR